MRIFLVPGIMLVLTLAPQSANAQTQRPVMQGSVISIEPILDGNVVDDPAWRNLVPASGFWQVQPDEGRPATQKTEVTIGFTNDALYIGVMAYDDEPDKIIVADRRRDSNLRNSDSFQVIIDGLNDKQNGFVFGTNPAGIEYDGQVSREGARSRTQIQQNF